MDWLVDVGEQRFAMDARCANVYISPLSLSFAPNLASETETRDVYYYIHTQYAVDGGKEEMGIGNWERVGLPSSESESGRSIHE